MRFADDCPLEDLTLAELLDRGRDHRGNLTFYKLTFNAFDQLARQNAADDETYRRSLVALVSGFLASLQPELLPQAVVAKNLLLKKIPF